ncbi:MAG: CCA tRNA nucleotidyltransferase, partial [Nitrospiraceae bacterium]
PNLDVDLVIEGEGIAFARALGRQQGATVKAHERFGTAVVILPDGFKLDVATARTEYYEYPTALPTVERSSIKKDLYRRDFTINTLAVRLNADRFGELIDFYGGRRDLDEKTIRVLHSLSFVEDPTRVFRAIRFEHRFGFRLGKETLTLIKGAVKMDLFHRLSGSRLQEELILLLSEEEPREAIARLDELDLLRFVHPSLKWSPRLATLLKSVEEALGWYKIASLNWVNQTVGAGGARVPVAASGSTGDGLPPTKVGVGGASSGPSPTRMDAWLVYFMALMEVIPGKAVGETLKRLPVPERHAERIRAAHFSSRSILRQLAKRPPPGPSEVYRVLAGHADETLLFVIAKTKLESVRRQVSAYLTAYRHVKPALTGADLKALGIKPGPIFKKILGQLHDARLNGEIHSEAEERELVKRIVRS